MCMYLALGKTEMLKLFHKSIVILKSLFYEFKYKFL